MKELNSIKAGCKGKFLRKKQKEGRKEIVRKSRFKNRACEAKTGQEWKDT